MQDTPVVDRPTHPDRNGDPRRGERGQMLPLFAISIVVILGLIGLGLDGARIFVERRQAQGAADLAALAAARSLPDNPTQAKADGVAIAAANGFTITEADVVTPYEGKASKVKVLIPATVPMLFTAVLGIGSTDINSSAVATHQAAVVAGESVPLAGPAILAADPVCGKAANTTLKWTGASATIVGLVVSNGGVDMSGTGNVMTGTYVDDPPTCDNSTNTSKSPGAVFSPTTTSSGFPLDTSAAVFADPIGAGVCDYYLDQNEVPDAYWVGGVKIAGGQIMDGVYCRVDNATTPTALAIGINLKTNDMHCDYCTFIGVQVQATGTNVSITSPAIAVNALGDVCDMPANTCGGYPLFVYATYSGSKAVNWSGGGAQWSGLMFTPNGHTYVSGADSAIYDGAVWGRLVEVSGANFTMNGPTEWNIAGPSSQSSPEVLALTE